MEWLAGLALVLFLMSRGGKKPGGTGELPTPGGGDKPPRVPPGSDKPKPTPKPKPTDDDVADDEIVIFDIVEPVPFKGGRVWGDTSKVPSWWRGDWNDFWISPDCDVVAEGARFLPESGNFWAYPEPTLAETLAAKLGGGVDPNTAWGFIDYLVDVEGLLAAETVTLRIVQDAAPICADVPQQQWPTPLASWFDNFVGRVEQSEYFET